MSAIDEVIGKLYRDRPLAHAVLFAHRHTNKTPPFHATIINDFHGPEPSVCEILFRGAAKSTLAEEGIVIKACFREFLHPIIIGATLDKAQERLHSIRRQFEKNERLLEIFGDLKGHPWGDDKIELSTGITIQAIGRGQAIRGTKAEDFRPDFILADDIEDAESLRTPEGREKIRAWFFSELLPAGDIDLKVRLLANDMGVDCIANLLDKPGSGFLVRRFPWLYLDEQNRECATWEDRFPLPVIYAKRDQMGKLGRMEDYNKEYMCQSESPSEKPFKEAMFRVEPIVKTWQAVYGMFDPARTVNQNSCQTGFACWSWVNNRLIVWDAWGKGLMPDQLISEIFKFDAEFQPTEIGVEEDGLNEWILQPIRQEQLKRRVTIPLKPVKAPKGKMSFIRSLQPFANAHEIVFAKPLPDLMRQLLSLRGEIDIANALAYATKMRPGQPLYEDFTNQHIMEGLEPSASLPAYLLFNAKAAITTAALAQIIDGGLRIYADWVREGEPSDVVRDIIMEADIEANRKVRIAAGPIHFDQYNNVGLVQAAKKVHADIDIRNGVAPAIGRPELRALMRRQTKGLPCFIVSSSAKWTLNGLAGGYCREVLKTGALADYAEDGIYKILIEGIESFAGLFRSGLADEDDSGINWRYTGDGRRVISARRQG